MLLVLFSLTHLEQDCQSISFLDISYFLFYKFIYLFMAALGLHCCVWAFSSCSKWGLLFIVVCSLLTVVTSLVEKHGF